jgi:hypothetical protein
MVNLVLEPGPRKELALSLVEHCQLMGSFFMYVAREGKLMEVVLSAASGSTSLFLWDLRRGVILLRFPSYLKVSF